MKALRRIILVFTITAGTYILVPLFLLIIGIYNIDDFFHRPPSARVVALHVDHNIPDEAGAPSMRVTSRIKTYNMGVNDLSIQIDFLYKDGAPILSRIDRNDIEVSQLAQSLGNDSLITVVLFVPYNVYPDECHDKRIKGKVYLSYTGQKGITVRQKQRKKISIKSLNKVINDGVINENNTSSKKRKGIPSDAWGVADNDDYTIYLKKEKNHQVNDDKQVSLWIYKKHENSGSKILTTNPEADGSWFSTEHAIRIPLDSIATISKVSIISHWNEPLMLLVEGSNDDRNINSYIIKKDASKAICLPTNRGMIGISEEESLLVMQSYKYYNQGGRYNVIETFDREGNRVSTMNSNRYNEY